MKISAGNTHKPFVSVYTNPAIFSHASTFYLEDVEYMQVPEARGVRGFLFWGSAPGTRQTSGSPAKLGTPPTDSSLDVHVCSCEKLNRGEKKGLWRQRTLWIHFSTTHSAFLSGSNIQKAPNDKWEADNFIPKQTDAVYGTLPSGVRQRTTELSGRKKNLLASVLLLVEQLLLS